MKSLVLLLYAALAAPALFGQVPHLYSATTGDVTLSSAATAFTIQQPATKAKQVDLISAVLYCSVSCNISQAQNGTAATSTAGTANLLSTYGPPASATVWTASNVGTGTPAGGIYHLPAAQTVTFDLSNISMGNTGTGTNYTISIGSLSGVVNITLYWQER